MSIIELDEVPPVPTPVVRLFDFSDWQASHPGEPLPGDRVDDDFDSTNAAINLVAERLALIQRDDGELPNGSVDFEQLHPDVVSFMTGGQGVLPPPTPANAGKALAVNDEGDDYDFIEVMLYDEPNNRFDAQNLKIGNVGYPESANDAATKQFVEDVLEGESPGSTFTTGDVKATIKVAADPGWIMCDDGSIGNAASGATTRANADCANLFALIWTNIPQAICPVQTSSGVVVARGASAAADFAADRRIVLPQMRGRALAAATGIFPVGTARGAETQTLTAANLAAHTHPGTTGGITANHSHTFTSGVESASHQHAASLTGGITEFQGAHTHSVPIVSGEGATFGVAGTTGNLAGSVPTSSDGSHQHGVNGTVNIGSQNANHTHSGSTGTVSADHAHNFTTGSTGSATPFSLVQLTTHVNFQMKL